MRSALHAATFLVVGIFTAHLVVAEKAPRQRPMTIETEFKDRIEEKFRVSLAAATEHLALVLGIVGPGSAVAKEESPEPFGRYELELSGNGHWRTNCEVDIDKARDGVSLCALHKLQSLTALCEVKEIVTKYSNGIYALINYMVNTQDQLILGLGAKHGPVPGMEGSDMWMIKESPKSNQYNISLAVHSAAMLATLQCGKMLERPDLFQKTGGLAQRWFESLKTLYKKEGWAGQSYLENSIIWEALLRISQYIQPGSLFREGLDDWVKEFGSSIQTAFVQDPEAWTFTGANAAAQTWADEKQATRKKRLGRHVDQYIKRWQTNFYTTVKGGEKYTCSMLRGLMPLLRKWDNSNAAQMVRTAMQLLEQDIDIFQINFVESQQFAGPPPSKAVGRINDKVLKSHGKTIEGAFLRDSESFETQSRWTIRMDDTANCVVALTKALQLLDEFTEATTDTASIQEWMNDEL